MVRGLIIGAVLAFVFIVYAAVDCALYPARQVRVLSKPAWVTIIIVVPLIGAVLWFVFGRGKPSGRAGVRGPDDDPDFLSRIGLGGGGAGPRRPRTKPGA